MNPVDFGGSATHFGLDLVAEFAFLVIVHRRHDELHAACFPGTVLSVAMLTEMSPFPIATLKPMLIVEAHVSISKKSGYGQVSAWSAPI